MADELKELTLIRAKDKKKLNVFDSLVNDGIAFTNAYDAADTITLTLNDPGWVILTSGFFDRKRDDRLDAIDLKLDGQWFRLTQVSADDGGLSLIFEDRTVQRLRNKFGHKTVSRNKQTRAQFVRDRIKALRIERVGFYSRELKDKQQIGTGTSTSDTDRKDTDNSDASLSGGPSNFSSNQQTFAEAAAGETGLDVRVIAAWMVKEFGGAEKTSRADAPYNFMAVGFTDSGDTSQSKSTVFSDPARAGAYTGKFMKGETNPKSSSQIQAIVNTAGESIEKQVRAIIDSNWASSHYHHDYSGFVSLAQSFDASGDSSVSSSRSSAVSYQYEVAKNENYWDAIQRLAEEVKWRAFMHRGVFYFMDDFQLLRAKAMYTLKCQTAPELITKPSFEWDNRGGFPQELSFSVLMARDYLEPGDVVIVTEAGPANGRWLVKEVSGTWFNPAVNISLIQPQVPKLEPAHESQEVSDADGGSGGNEGGTGGTGTFTGDTSGLVSDMKEFVGLIAGETTESILVNSGRRNDPGSNHNTGRAADLDVGGDARSSSTAGSKGDNICIAALVVCGHSRDEAKSMIGGPRTNFSQNSQWNGHSVEIGWRTLEGGNHFNHVHVGFDS